MKGIYLLAYITLVILAVAFPVYMKRIWRHLAGTMTKKEKFLYWVFVIIPIFEVSVIVLNGILKSPINSRYLYALDILTLISTAGIFVIMFGNIVRIRESKNLETKSG